MPAVHAAAAWRQIKATAGCRQRRRRPGQSAWACAGLPAGRPAGSLVRITYSYARKGRIHLTAEDQEAGRLIATEIAREAGLGATEVSEQARRLGLKSIE